MRKFLFSIILIFAGVLSPALAQEVSTTDVSSLNAALYSKEMTVQPGGQLVLPIYMKNSQPVTLFQTNVYLPDGFSFAKKSSGKYDVSLVKTRLTDEDDNHVISANLQADGSLLILCSSQDNYTFDGTDGQVATVAIDVADNVAEGKYSVQLNNQKLVRPDNTGDNIATYQVAITVQNTPAYDEGYSLSIIPGTIESASSAAKSTTVSLAMNTAKTMHSVSFDMYWSENAPLYKKSGSYQAFYDTDNYEPSDEDENYVKVDDEGYTNGANISFTDDTGDGFKTSYESIVSMTFRASKGTDDGIYPVELKNIVFTDDEGNTYNAAPTSTYMKVGSPSNTTVALSGNISSDVVEKLASDESIGTLDISNVTGIEGTFTLVDGRSIIVPTKPIPVEEINYSRTFESGQNWGTICLPYAVSSTSSVGYYKVSAVASGVLTLEKYETLPANTPALVRKLSGDGIASNAENVEVGGALGDVTGVVTMKGSFTDNTKVTDANAYYIKDNEFWKCNGNFIINAFRAYFTVDAENAKTCVFSISDDAMTAINALVGVDSTGSPTRIIEIYGVNGAKYSDLQKGLNIVKLSNGKTQKIIIK